MKIKQNKKVVKTLLKFLAVPALFGAIVASTTYGTTNSISKQSGMINQATTVADDQPTIDDVVNGDVSSLNQPIRTTAGDYILPTLTADQTPGMLKANSFVTKVYGINFNNFQNYHVRQIVQNYNDENQYFVLLVDDNASVPVTFDTNKITFGEIVNPGHVIVVADNGSDFRITADYELDAPILDQSMMAYYMGMRFQQPLGPNQIQDYTGNTQYVTPWETLSPRYTGIDAPVKRSGQLDTLTLNTMTSLKRLNETWSNYSNPASIKPYSQNVATFLYLNSLNNMVFVSNKVNNSGSDAIYLFGGNQAINLWFYTFTVNDLANPRSTRPNKEYATAYANYRISFPDVGGITSTLDSSDIDTQKAYNINYSYNAQGIVPTSARRNPYANASFFGYYVAGAKYVQQPGQIELALTIPNFALFQNNIPVIFSTNVFLNYGDKYAQPPQSRILNLYGSISNNIAIQTTTTYRDEQVKTYTTNGSSWSSSNLWVPRYSNNNYNFVNVWGRGNGQRSYDITATENDGYKSKLFNKLVAYVPQTFNNLNVALKYTRDKMAVVDLSDTNKSSLSSTLNIRKSNTSMRNLTNVWFENGTYYLTYKAADSKKSVIYAFSYNGTLKQGSFTQSNLVLDGDLDVLNILPLNTDYVYVLAKNVTTNKVIPLLYQARNNVAGSFEPNVAFNNLRANNEINQVMGIPTYAAADGIQNENQKAVWGTVQFKDVNYLQNAGFFSNQAATLVDDIVTVPDILVDYISGWNGQDVKANVTVNQNNELEVQISIKYLDGHYYSPQQLLAQNSLTKVYGGFGATPQWVIAVAIAVPISVVAIIIALGLGFGIPMYKNHQLQKKGFNTTIKKVDTLTTAVDYVYKKMVDKTAKKPRKLKASEAKKLKQDSKANSK